ncbi:MAG: hypothetical protein ACRDRJ_47225 [Streptosporangiaceae bacterium]
MNDNGSLPVTYRLAASVPITGALMRYQLLSRRDLLSKTATRCRPQGRRRPGGAASEPLTVAGHLELLALGEHLACHFRHLVLIHHAVHAGATWPQIAVAPGRKSLHVRQDYAEWADSQRARAKQSPGMTAGFSEAEHTTALAAAACPPCPQCVPAEAAWDGNDGTSGSWHCCACRHDYSAGGQS